MSEEPGTQSPDAGGAHDGRVRLGEWRAVAWSFLYFFCVLAAYYVMRPVREQLSAAVGSTQLPWFFAATLIATLALTPVFSWLVARWPRRVVIPVVYLFFIACLLAFVPLFVHPDLLGPRALGTVFFVWVSVFNLFVVSVFWSFMADIWNDEQARRLFPIIALGGTGGAIVGPMLTRQLVDLIGIAPLLVVSAGLLGIALGCVVALGRWARLHSMRRHVIGHEDAVGGGMFDGLKQIFADRFMRNMALLMLLGDAIGTIAYASVADYSGATFHDAVARTRFAANVDLATNIFQICVQVTLTRWLLKRSGAGPVIAVWAVVGVVVCLAMAVSGDPYAPALPLLAQHVSAWSAVIRSNGVAAFFLRLPVELLPVLSWVVLMLVVTRGLVYAMVQPARESLYTRVPRDLRYKGKNAVDTAVWRAGDVMSSLSINGLRALGMSIAGFGLIGAAALTASGVIGWRLAKWIEREPASDARASDAHASTP